MNAHRVLVVDDSAFMRKIISDIIITDPQFNIVATAANGCEAIEAVERWKPDVITMDLEMPEMNGLEALTQIMRSNPTPVIMLSSISDDGTRETIKALQNGAFDFIRKPSGPRSSDIHTVGEQLLEKMRIAVLTKSRAPLFQIPGNADTFGSKDKERPQKLEKTIKPAANSKAEAESVKSKKRVLPDNPVISKPDSKPEGKVSSDVHSVKRETKGVLPKKKPANGTDYRHLIVIGTSTGGPRALHEVITALPGSLPAPVLVVQHMPPKFTHSLAQRLDAFSSVHVVEAANGDRVYAGTVYIAPGGYHMELAKDSNGYYISLNLEQPVGGHRPSVDVMFESCVSYPELRRHSVIMTGMGNDGVKGMRALNESGGVSAIAEAEESCIVYGMPRSAVEAGVAKSVVPLQRIASMLVEAVMK
ncbi:chemotaxis response regulator protein-glutamate methylesterase [Paenibacillus sp. sptzw28]|uniref:protein-glutamate methylesterase/protein-glutamine glutaminase n=1 Tax=Paenibacillus sp. sptzw28 TaxID=715179 RepID=UPI001C6EF574|nr:chemotaxis response regulator protein-glutamate methylesterase [Paenibacillus sp. sptzw28]QYR19753.1 chemotaxis response regulator protein-glutamate methylesterase [Paenibacillus sp. sptzw28]